MKKCGILALCALALALCGCSRLTQVENQAFAVAMSVDGTESGEIEVAVQTPSLDAGSSGEGGGGGGSGAAKYLVSSATGASFPEALNLLEATVSSRLNLSQLKIIVVSSDLASQVGFSRLMHDIATTHDLFAPVQLIVSTTKAKDFVSAGEPSTGVRLSTAIVAQLESCQKIGYIPESTLLDVYSLSESHYGDPVAPLAATASGTTFRPIARGRLGDAYAGALPRSGENRNEFFGSALFREGQMVGVLTGWQTVLLNVLLGEIDAFTRIYDGRVLEMERRGSAGVSVDLSGAYPVIEVALRLKAENESGRVVEGTLARELEAELDELTTLCRSLAADPFRYASFAAAQFAATEDWIAYGWREKFPNARVRYRVSLD